MQKIKIFTDSPADVQLKDVEKYNIGFFPVKIQFGDETYRDYIDISCDEFYKKLVKSDEIPTTSQVTIPEFQEGFTEAVKEGYETIICFTIEKAASGTYQNAVLAKNMVKEEFPDADIEIIPGRLSYIYGDVVVTAAEMAMNGKSKKEILDYVNGAIDNRYAIFVASTLKYLKKGGRINPTVATIGEVLNIKPLLTIKNGLVDAAEKVRGEKKVIPKMMEHLEKNGIADASKVYIFNGAASDANITALRAALEEKFGLTDVPTALVGPVIGTHIGPGLFGVLVVK